MWGVNFQELTITIPDCWDHQCYLSITKNSKMKQKGRGEEEGEGGGLGRENASWSAPQIYLSPLAPVFQICSFGDEHFTPESKCK